MTCKTAKGHRAQIRRLSKWLGKQPLSRPALRDYLKSFNGMSSSTYANVLKSLRVFCRDYLKRPDLVESFRFPKKQFRPKWIPSKKDLQRFFEALSTPKDRALFMLFASSGLRRQEILSLSKNDLDFSKRMIKPRPHKGRTKHAWISFFNTETAETLRRYLTSRIDNNPRLFPMARAQERKLWRKARLKTGLEITPQVLREWFCATMGELGMPDRYVDAFCGRVPNSILGRHYTDYSPIKLKEIYDRASLSMINDSTQYDAP